MKGAAMVDSNYLEELLEGIPDGLFDGNYSGEDLLKMVDLPMESFANDDSQTEFDVNEMNIPWPSSYVDYKPVDSAVWNNTVSEQKPNLIPLNSSVSLPGPILSDDSVRFPLVLGENVTNHINGTTGLDTLVDIKPTVRSLNGLISKSGSIPSYRSSVHIFETAPIRSAAVPESKPKLIPSNSVVTESNPMTMDAMIGSRVVVECNIPKNTVDNAQTDILPQQKPHLADGKPKVVESGSSRIHSPVSVLDTRNCNSVQTSMSNIMSKKGARYGKRSKRPRSEHIKTPWFHITLIPPTVSSKKRNNTSQGSDRYKTESKLFEFPSCWKKKQTMAPPEGVIGTTKKCSHCEVTKTPQWREGPNGPKTLCNACGVRYRSGRLFPEYRPAASPTFTPYLHSNSHRKVVEMRKQQGGILENKVEQDFPVAGDTVMDHPRSPDSPLIENIPMIGHPFELIY